MKLVFKSAPAGHRVELPAAKCNVSYYPKGRRCLPIDIELNGKTVEMRVTHSATYATAPTSGHNGYFIDPETGFCYWVSFDPGYHPDGGEEFDFLPGSAPKNPVREPRLPEKEAARRALLSASLRAKFATVQEEEEDEEQEAA